MGLTSPPPIWAMSLNILFFFSDVTPYVLVDVSHAAGINAAVGLLLDLRNTSFDICNKRLLCFS